MNRSKPILLVEDSQDHVFFMKRALKEASITNPFFVAGNGQEAVDYLSGTAQFGDRSKYPNAWLDLFGSQTAAEEGP